MAFSVLLVMAVLTVSIHCPLVTSCSIEEADVCGASAFLFSLPNFTIPIDEASLGQFCTLGGEKITCIEDFKDNCMKPATGRIMGLLLKGMRTTLDRDFCGGGPQRERLFAQGACLQGKGADLHACMKRFVADMEISSRTHPDDAIPYGCCFFNELEACAMNVGEQCGHDTALLVDDIIRGQTQDILGAVCASYRDDPSQCNTLDPLDRSIPAAYLSVLPSLVKVIDTLSS